MELLIEEPNITEGVSLCHQFENDIPDDAMAINVKLNFDASCDDYEFIFPAREVRQYIEDTHECKILFATCGIHFQGQSMQPHYHYHMITTPFKVISNPSQHRRRWWAKNKTEFEYFLDCSFKYHRKLDLKNPKSYILSYPLKEGNYLKRQKASIVYYQYLDCSMSKEQLQFLLNQGRALFEQSQAEKLSRDKSGEGTQLTSI